MTPEMAQEHYEQHAPECAAQGHIFNHSWETNEPLGRCQRCGISVAGAEQEDEAQVPE